MAENQNLHENVKSFVEKMLSDIKVKRDDIEARTSAVRESLFKITLEYSTEKYCFNLAMEFFVEAAYKNLSECLLKILDETDLKEAEDDVRDICFAALYALSLIYKKQDNVEGLRELIGDKYSKFKRYPLYYEICSRYYKRDDDFRKALSSDKRAINILNKEGITNLALCISYASTVCSMLRKKDPSLCEEDTELAQRYIEDAIAFNPKYPKYYFLKAQLIFLSAVNSGCALPELEAAGKQAKRIIDEEADVILYELYRDENVFDKDRESYELFKNYIDDVISRKKYPRFVKSDEELDALKEKILAAESQDVCSSSSILPPVPAFHKDDKYFFVCYSSRDFKSVYCDLIELYKRKVPFRYDKRLTNGDGWQGQIENGIGDENCVGVVFYLSKNVLSTNSVCEEIEITEKHGRPNFFVNLEGSKAPSLILTDLLIERYLADSKNYAIPGKQMKQFIVFFSDDKVFTHKLNGGDNTSTLHLDAFIDNLVDKFPQIIIGD